jgi:fermentation-respiration switch protein FrsA (DUF1100 family)
MRLATLVFVAAAGLLAVWFAQRGFIYFPEGQVPVPAGVGLRGAEPVRLTSSDGLDLEAWWLPAQSPPADRTVIVFNGNAGNRASRALLGASLAARGFAVLLVDYRGYGGNPGLPSEAGLYRDARAALAYVLSRADVNPARLVYFGESLGAAVALELAIEHPPAALVLRSPFSSMVSIGTRHYPFLPVRLLLRDRYPSIERIGRLRSPALFIAGEDDRIIPLEDTRVLFDAAPEPKQLVVIRGADHNDEELLAGTEMMRAIDAFLR